LEGGGHMALAVAETDLQQNLAEAKVAQMGHLSVHEQIVYARDAGLALPSAALSPETRAAMAREKSSNDAPKGGAQYES